MIFLSILILIVAIALPSINLSIRQFLYIGISSIIFIFAGALSLNAFYVQSIGSGIGIYSGLFQVTDILLDYLSSWTQFNLSSTELIILNKVILFSIWFIIGVYSYLKIFSTKFKNKINTLTLFEFIIILYTFFFILKLLGLLLESYLFSLQIPDLSIYSFINGHSSASGNIPSLKSTLDTVGDTAIMTASVTAAGKLAQQCPNAAVKAAFLLGGVVIGGTGIIVKNVTGKIGSDIGNNFIPSFIEFYNNHIYKLTGNNVIDLLNLIQIFQKVSLLFIFLICYNLIVCYINENLVESILIKVFPQKLVHLYIKSLKLLKKSAFVIIICSFILLIVSNLYSYYYLQFFIDNLDKIIEFYFKK